MKIKIVSLLAVGIMLLTAISFSGCALFDKEEESHGIATTSVAICEILGHKNPTVTLNRYAHSLMEHKADMMNRLGKLL